MTATYSNEIRVRSGEGAVVFRDVDASPAVVVEHSHDVATLTINLIGGFWANSEAGTCWIRPGSVIFHPAGAAHAAGRGPAACENLVIELDPKWLRPVAGSLPLEQSHYWTNGLGRALGRSLYRAWLDEGQSIRQAVGVTAEFLVRALTEDKRKPPPWMERLEIEMDCDRPITTRELASKLGLHPAWLAQAYRANNGEGLQMAYMRRRLDRAARLLTLTSAPLAEVALDAGFCDQAHMNRCFRRLVGRTPFEVRRHAIDRKLPGAAPLCPNKRETR